MPKARRNEYKNLQKSFIILRKIMYIIVVGKFPTKKKVGEKMKTIVCLDNEQLSLLRTVCKINRSKALERARAYRALDCLRSLRDTNRLIARYDTLLFLFKEVD